MKKYLSLVYTECGGYMKQAGTVEISEVTDDGLGVHDAVIERCPVSDVL